VALKDNGAQDVGMAEPLPRPPLLMVMLPPPPLPPPAAGDENVGDGWVCGMYVGCRRDGRELVTGAANRFIRNGGERSEGASGRRRGAHTQMEPKRG
jgi:hypothetical protein